MATTTASLQGAPEHKPAGTVGRASTQGLKKERKKQRKNKKNFAKGIDRVRSICYTIIRKGKEIKTMKIWLDMDGTIADLYSVEGWLTDLINHDERPYREAKPLVRMCVLARLLNKAQRNGYEICVVTALAKNSTNEYDERVIETKKIWLKTHLKSVKFDEVKFVPYTFTKNDVNSGNDILFDDEERHLTAWTGTAYNAKEILEVLKSL